MELPQWLKENATEQPAQAERRLRPALLDRAAEKTLRTIEQFLAATFAATLSAKKSGLWQALDPRVKVLTTVVFIGLLTFERQVTTLLLTYGLALILTAASRLLTPSYLARTWGFTLFFAGLMVLPLTVNWVTPGEPLLVLLPPGKFLHLFDLPSPLAITVPGLQRAATVVLRTATAISFTFLLTSTTPWPALLKALRTLYMPRLIIAILEVTFRYIFLLVRVARETLEARRLRLVGPLSAAESRAFSGALIGTIVVKSYALHEAVHEAMRARGYTGEPVLTHNFRLRFADLAWLGVAIIVVVFLVYFDRQCWLLPI